jgi:hypothetical protein
MFGNNFYINRAIYTAEEAEKLLAAVKRCLVEARWFPIYLDDLKILVENLTYINVMHNAVMNDRAAASKKKPRRKRK